MENLARFALIIWSGNVRAIALAAVATVLLFLGIDHAYLAAPAQHQSSEFLRANRTPKRCVVDRSDTDLERVASYPRGVIDGCIRAHESIGPRHRGIMADDW
ncbi:MAG TPA: hypothetical protein VK755_02685 [Candidatus Acidoferrales bacterium]|nr:hypothetical protein [Candidatus Acidoferrales bacterium]